MTGKPRITPDQKIALHAILASLNCLTDRIRHVSRRDRISDEEARTLLEPILRIRSLLAEIQAAGAEVDLGSSMSSLADLESAYLSLEGAIKEKRNEQLRVA